MNLKDIRNLNITDLAQREKTLRKELFDMRQQSRMGKVEKPASFKTVRKEIAQILTVIKERKI